MSQPQIVRNHPDPSAAYAELWETMQFIRSMENACAGSEEKVLSPDDLYFILSHVRQRLQPVLRNLGA